MFISFEGIDGSGKSTQARLLADYLKSKNKEVVLTREPGGSAGAEVIRRLLVEGDTDRWSAETEILLFNAARRDHLEKTIRPALDAGKFVITDRFADSTRIYQGVARADLSDFVMNIHNLAIGVDPDLTFIIDADPNESLSRGLARNSGEDRFEDFGLKFQQNIREGFLKLADTDQRFALINGMQEIERVAADIAALLDRHL
ncbi:MAG: dTMP kinase [Pseudomonadota bacterium]